MHRFWLAATLVACVLLVSPASDAAQRERPAGAEPRGGAVPRDSGGGSSGGGTMAPAPSPPSTSGAGGGGRGRATSGGSGGSTRAVPRGDRPRDGRSTIGSAVPRTYPPYGGGGGGYYPGDYYWWSRPAYWYGYGALGLGYFYYDPFWWGVPYGGYGYPYYAYGGYPYGGGYASGGGYGGGYQAPNGGAYEGVGQLRLKVKPRDAEVYVDGYLVGIVTNFDGVFQRLDLNAGPHKVEIRKPGYETLSIDVRIQPDETTTYHGELKPAPGGTVR